MKHRILSIALAALFLAGPPEGISAPPLINYQGRIAVGIPAVNFDGTGQFKFALVNGAGNIVFWSNSPDVAPADGVPDTAVPLTVVKGLYSVLLGDTSLGAPMAAIPASALTTNDVRLRVWFSDNTPTGFQLLSPDQRLAPTAYLADGVVSSTHIAAGAVNNTHIAPYAIRTEHFYPGSLDFSILQTANGAAPGTVLGFNGASMVWTTPGGPGGIWALNGTNDAYYNGGKVGIGINTPGDLLHLQSGGGGIRFSPSVEQIGSSANGGELSLVGGVPASATRGAQLRLGGGSRGDGDVNAAIFLQNGVERMRINNGGQIGIGTATPGYALDIVTYNPVIMLRDTGSSNARSAIQGVGGDVNLFTESYLSGANPFAYLKLANNGNVGIGSSTPVGKLEVVAQDALRMIGFNPFLTFYDSGAGYAASRIQGVGGALVFATQSYLAAGGGNHYARLDDNGNFTVRMLTIRGGADLAEPFQMKEDELEKGSVVVIDDEHPGRLKRSLGAYDTRVAGIVSGANGIDPGIALHQEGVIEGGQNVALTGRVYVQADASSGPIKPGDLLTTSDLPGHAMKVTDHAKAQGAVIGKAMSSLHEGTGMVLVLVTLQ